MYHIYSKFGISRFPFSADMSSSSPRNIYKSPHNVQIANFQNAGGLWIPCPYLGCILSFTTPNGLRKHSRTGKHRFNSNAQSPPSSVHGPQRYKPQLVVKTLGKTPCIPKVSRFK